MNKNNYVSIVSAVFLVVGTVHALRIFNGWEVTIGSVMLPMWASWAGVLLAYYLAFFGFGLMKKS